MIMKSLFVTAILPSQSGLGKTVQDNTETYENLLSNTSLTIGILEEVSFIFTGNFIFG